MSLLGSLSILQQIVFLLALLLELVGGDSKGDGVSELFPMNCGKDSGSSEMGCWLEVVGDEGDMLSIW